ALAPADLLALDVGAVRREVGPLIDRAGALVRDAARSRRGSRASATAGGRASAPRPRSLVEPSPAVRRRLRPGADLVGADLRALDLTGADLRGALLLGADLRGSRLDVVDLLGADLRGADARGTDLSQALFLTPAQAGAVRRDERTALPDALRQLATANGAYIGGRWIARATAQRGPPRERDGGDHAGDDEHGGTPRERAVRREPDDRAREDAADGTAGVHREVGQALDGR